MNDPHLYLVPECISGLGDDTFWLWMLREFPEASVGVPEEIGPQDLILQYGTLGPSRFPAQTIALLWELYPEMQARLGGTYPPIAQLYACAESSRWATIASPYMRPFYAPHRDGKSLDVLPIGVDTALFHPVSAAEQLTLRQRLGIPQNKMVAFWSGTTHPMKGFDQVEQFAQHHPEVFWICAWKTAAEGRHWDGPGGTKNTFLLPQRELAEYMQCADFFFTTGRLYPYFMVEWEAMAVNLPFQHPEGLQREFAPFLARRAYLESQGWDRPTAKILWTHYLAARREELVHGRT